MADYEKQKKYGELYVDPVYVDNDDEERYKPTLAVMCRLLEPWFNTGRVVVGDSWFGSVDATSVLRKKGLYPLFMMKKKRFWPRNYPGNDIIGRLENGEIGKLVKFVAQYDGIPMLAVGLKTRKPRCYLTSFGTLNRGATVTTTVVDAEGRSSSKPYRPPEIAEVYSKCRDGVDIHNKYRHRSFDLRWRTKNWIIREFQFVIEIAMVNSFLMAKKYRYLVERQGGAPSEIQNAINEQLFFKLELSNALVGLEENNNADRGDELQRHGVAKLPPKK